MEPAGADDAGAGGFSAEGKPGGNTVFTMPNGMQVEISQASVRQWLPVPFRAIANARKDETLALTTFDEELLTPGVTGCINRYLPDLLKNTDSPELALLGIGLTVYAGRVVGTKMLERLFAMLEKMFGAPKAQPEQRTSDHATPTAGSAASPASSANRAPAKPSVPADSVVLAGIALPRPSE